MLELIFRIFDMFFSKVELGQKKDDSQYWTTSPLDEQRKQRTVDGKKQEKD